DHEYIFDLDIYLYFFFQAEDGIRDLTVTGVQTCALPISSSSWPAGVTPGPSAKRATRRRLLGKRPSLTARPTLLRSFCPPSPSRSEERRVGKECRYRWSPYQKKQKLV